MKKLSIIALLCVSSLGLMHAAEWSNPAFTNSLDGMHSSNPLMVDGAVALGSNGYIVTAWVDTAAQGFTMIGAGELSDTWGVPEMVDNGVFGFGTPAGSLGLTPGETFGVTIRLFNVGTAISGDWSTVEAAWADGTIAAQWAQLLINGGSYWEYSYSETADVIGRINSPSTWTTGTLNKVSGPAVPEPSTYAALAGLAMLVFVAARRVRK